jgi:pullulanase/glycogen debranching enzyme
MRVWPGRPYPQGATWDGSGVNFALFAENATGVELCLFETQNRRLRPRESRSPSNNHTAEGNHLGPTLCFRGVDNAAYYRLVPDDRRY